LVGLAVLGILPLFAPVFIQSTLILLLLYLNMTQGYNIMLIQGDLSFGPAAFMGTGAYTVAVLLHYGISTNPILNILIAVLVSGALGIVLGFPLLKLRGIYFAIGTLGLAEIMRLITTSTPFLGGGTGLLVSFTAFLQSYSITYFYYVLLGITLILSVFTYYIFHSKFGLALAAIKDNIEAARSLGINATAHRLMGFSLSGALIGLVGAYFAYYNGFVYPDNVFSINISFTILTIAFFGGEATFLGPIVGGVAVILAEQLAQSYILQGYQVILAILLVVVFLVMPGGVVGALTKKTPLVNPFHKLKRRELKTSSA